MGLSVIIPTLNAALQLPACLEALVGFPDQVIVVDGGSNDATCEIAARRGAHMLEASRGRGVQLRAGIAAARGSWLLLLHADTRLQPGWQRAACQAMREPDRAGYFRFALDSSDRHARQLERMVAWRCRWLGLPYGDQGLLISRTLLETVGGVRPLALMEDVDLVQRIGRRRLVNLDAAALTSAQRWEQDGWRRRSARNVGCLGLYLLGVPTPWIARLYA